MNENVHLAEEPASEAWRALDDLKQEFKSNIDKRSAEDSMALFDKMVQEYESLRASNPKDKTLWAKELALRIIAEDADIEFAQTQGGDGAENKRKIGNAGYFKNKYNEAQKRIAVQINKEADAVHAKLYGKK